MMTLDHAWNSLVTLTLQSVVLCLMAGIGLLLLRKAAASTRHLVLVLSMGALLAVPFLALFVPHWQVPLDTQPSAPAPPAVERTVTPAPTAGSEAQLRPSRTSALTAYASVDTPPRSQPRESAPALPQQNLSPAVSTPAGGVRNGHAGELRRARVPIWQTARCRQTVLAIWLLGSALALLRLLAGLIGTWRVTSRETTADPLLSQTVARIQAELGLNRALTVRQTIAEADCRLPVPLTWGLFRPTVLLPPAFLEWPQERQRMVVLHELAHIQRADWLIQVLVQITLALYWFHPLVWWATHRLQAESERACDDTVLLTGVAPSAYAETLLELLRTMNRSKKSIFSPASLLSMARPPIEARLHAILSPQLRQRPPRSIVLLASVGAAACAIALASFQVKAGNSKALARAQPQALTRAEMGPVAGQTDAERASLQSQQSRSKDEAAILRKRLGTLEQLFRQNQKKNADLLQQVKALQAQRAKADLSNQVQGIRAAQTSLILLHRNGKRHMFLLTAPIGTPEQAKPVTEDQITAARSLLRDLEHQQTLLQSQAQQMQDHLRNGTVAYEDTLHSRMEVDANQARVDASRAQLNRLKAGHQPSVKEQALVQLRTDLAVKQAEMAEEQECRIIADTSVKAGHAGRNSLIDEETKVSRIQTEIDKIKTQIAQQNAR